MTARQQKISGTREWAVAGVNCATGCPHDCRYCYARYDKVVRKAELKESEWQLCKIHPEELNRQFPLFPGTVMFPTEHDIHPQILDACLTVLKNLLAAGNRVLVVTKPHLACVREMCREFGDRQEQILFRFTITARDNTILRLWEPGAPGYEERLAALRYAFEEGFATSVSVEPMLEAEFVHILVNELMPYVNHSIWLGKMNKIEERVSCHFPEITKDLKRIQSFQSDEMIRIIYKRLAHNKLLRWKESIKKVVGIPQAQQPGLDI
ncbi:MAG: radical SAM protein [Desulfocapsaceae bacterium]|nr:radical SAM protein [Desulfocapsaceae bacterium]